MQSVHVSIFGAKPEVCPLAASEERKKHARVEACPGDQVTVNCEAWHEVRPFWLHLIRSNSSSVAWPVAILLTCGASWRACPLGAHVKGSF